ncbi:hypothetical protein V6N13_096718 [Hibiscus sabdariffa]
MCKCRSHGTFPLFGLQSSHLNICYYHQDLHRRPLRPGSRPGFYGDRRALLLIGAWPLPRRPGIGHALKRHPFSGLVDSADGPDGEPAGRRPEHAGAEHAETARAGFHDRGDDVLHGRIKGPGLGRHHDPRRSTPPSRSADRLSPFHIRPGRIAGPHPLPSRQFQALFDSLFKVLFIFPSRYLFAIGLSPVFSLGRNFTARLGLHSQTTRLVDSASWCGQGPGTTGLSPSPAPLSRGLGARSVAEDASPDYNSDAEGRPILKLGYSRFARRY